MSAPDPYREFYEETGRMLNEWGVEDRVFRAFVLGMLLGFTIAGLIAVLVS